MSLRRFPENFKWSISSSAFQTEGAWNVDGKGPSICDTFYHQEPCKTRDKSTADVACDSYANYEADVEIIKQLNVKYYKFSFSWARILPKGTSDFVNEKGVAYYQKLIDLLLENGIQPMVTLFHFDLPQALQDRGGWMNKQCVYWFTDYAKFCFETFGGKVKYWFTINEPYVFAMFGYSDGYFPPAITGHAEWAFYLVMHHLLLAHAHSYRIYDKQFRKEQKGEISIHLDAQWFKPLDPDSIKDTNAATRCLEFEIGIVAHPIFSEEGDYPAIVKETIAKKSKEEGRSISRLPEFSKEEIEMLRGSADFIPINHFLSLRVTEADAELPFYFRGFAQMRKDMDVALTFDKSTFRYPEVDIHHEPESFRELLNFVRTEYNNPRIFITEHGCHSSPSNLEDTDTIKYHNDYLLAILDAIDDGCRVELYSAWCLMDNFEWGQGYIPKFGFYAVDFDDRDRKRTPKASAKFYAKVVADNAIDTSVEHRHSAGSGRWVTHI